MIKCEQGKVEIMANDMPMIMFETMSVLRAVYEMTKEREGEDMAILTLAEIVKLATVDDLNEHLATMNPMEEAVKDVKEYMKWRYDDE